MNEIIAHIPEQRDRPEREKKTDEKKLEAIANFRQLIDRLTNDHEALPDLYLTRQQRKLFVQQHDGAPLTPEEAAVIAGLTYEDYKKYENNKFRRNWLTGALGAVMLSTSLIDDDDVSDALDQRASALIGQVRALPVAAMIPEHIVADTQQLLTETDGILQVVAAPEERELQAA